ncbi:hypothetical protein MKK68_00400 [Methylobacterium sp. E-016]|uniref:hypothetical protein n=1 Tax=Methylobacterium sp. E-016 TaxID=2836556 RepID=UPI001FBA6F35|nr:hypothetical protein [Methylobacterium sp. E-016]MCJ2074123.1 hypothetical protein [Methylobacterium sp. E-016]
MIDPAAVEFFDPPEAEMDRLPYADAGLIPRVEAERLAVLHHLGRAQLCLSGLMNAIRSDPSDDAEADAWIRAHDAETNRAGEHLRALRDIRECQGQG